MKAATRIALVALIVIVIAGAAAFIAWRGVRSLDEPLNVAAPLEFKVPNGARFARVAEMLAAQGVVKEPRAWVLFARWKGVAASIKAGEYAIEPAMTPRELLEKMVSGQVVLHSLTIVDGWRVQDMLLAMRKNPDILMTLPATPAMPANLMETLGFPGVAAEGQFLPETYRFPTGTPDVELLRDAHAALKRVLDGAWQSRDPALPLQSENDLLILASIVQKESGLPEELPTIAGLYARRLAVGMRLQADPTIIYGMGDAYDGTIRTVDLHTDGPYNTYMRTGLPPTPIALAGAAVIAATAHPAKTDAVYFVASDKGDGSHVFSSTLEQQNAAVARYVARQRQKAAESPR